MNQTIYDNYIDPSHPTAYSSPGNVKRFYRNLYGKNEIDQTLAHVDSYSRHRQYKKPSVHNPYFIYSPREQCQMDLIDMQQLSKYNDGIRFLSILIDCFTRKAWVKKLKDKGAVSSLAAIEELVEEISPPVRSLLFDKGTEYTNIKVRTYLKGKNIKIIHPSSPIKAGIVERFNRTLQSLIYRYLTENETFRYVHVLDDLLTAYNNRGHRTLQYLTPNDAEKPENAGKVLCALNQHYSKALTARKEPKLSVGQTVRIAKLKDKMTRGYQETFNLEYFKIVEVLTQMPVPTYRLQSMNTDEIIQGSFYLNELQPVEGDVFKVERVLEKRTRKGKKEVLIKWLGFDDRHNTWEPATNVVSDYEQQQHE